MMMVLAAVQRGWHHDVLDRKEEFIKSKRRKHRIASTISLSMSGGGWRGIVLQFRRSKTQQ
jgi:hypothetical protein